MSDWQPIETAPRDGTEILMGCWLPDQGRGFGGHCWIWVVSGYIDDEGPFCEFTDYPIRRHRSPPTHWKPFEQYTAP